MTKTKTKKSLALSVLSMMLCVVMLIGSTFAWFTDSVTSGKNKIVSGVLDVELEYQDADGKWQKVDENTSLFSALESDGETEKLWEPGHTEVVYLKVSNVGNLALKYQFAVTVASESTFTNVLGDTGCKLSDYLVFGQDESDTEMTKYASREDAWAAAGDTLGLGTYTKVNDLLKPGEAEYAALIVYMPTAVGNAANYRGDVVPEIDFGVTLLATQTPFEPDSFGTDYDEDAVFPAIEKTVSSDGSVTFVFPDDNLSEKVDGDTVVSFPTGSFNEGDVVSLTAEMTEIGEAEAENYPVVDGLVPVGAVKLTLLVNGEPQTRFNGKTATVTTAIAAGAEDVSVKYISGDQAVEEHLESYDAETGALVFTTDHFSTFAVYAKDVGDGYKYFRTPIAGMWLNAEIKKAATGASSASINTVNNTIKSITFCEYDEALVGAAWEEGVPGDTDSEGNIRIFSPDGANVYICVQPETQIANENLDYLFMNMQALTTIDFGGDLFSTSDVTSMFDLFYACHALRTESFKQVETWDVSKVTNMGGMFRGCQALTDIDLSAWDTASLENISYMFMGDTALVGVDMSDWDVTHVTDMTGMFCNCSALTTAAGISTWSADSLAAVEQMFLGCSALEELDVSGFNVSEVKSLREVFSGCNALEKLEGLGNWNTSKATDMTNLFASCFLLTEFDLPGFVTSSAKTLSGMFASCKALTGINGLDTWNTSNVTDMTSMFADCDAMTEIDLTGWDTSKVTVMTGMFQLCDNLKEITLTGWTVKSNTKTTYMFSNCVALEKIYTDKDWEIKNESSSIFYNCQLLSGGNGTKWTRTYQDYAGYARVDRLGTKGYFTDISQKP